MVQRVIKNDDKNAWIVEYWVDDAVSLYKLLDVTNTHSEYTSEYVEAVDEFDSQYIWDDDIGYYSVTNSFVKRIEGDTVILSLTTIFPDDRFVKYITKYIENKFNSFKTDHSEIFD